MKTKFKERRKFKRALFSIEQGLKGKFALKVKDFNVSQELMAPILDISKGGVGFILEPNCGDKVGIDDKLMLSQLKICVGDFVSVLLIEPDLPLTVRGKIAGEFFSHVGVGCDFTQITTKSWDNIKEFIRQTYPNCIV
jgi:hypothetical protein